MMHRYKLGAHSCTVTAPCHAQYDALANKDKVNLAMKTRKFSED